MAKKKKYPKINPSFIEDHNGKIVEVSFPYKVYESIFEEMDELKDKISTLKKKTVKKKTAKKSM
ncbi:MAG: hypothetical protein ACHQVS_05205 [Candidatus Babeliales bacterium]